MAGRDNATSASVAFFTTKRGRGASSTKATLYSTQVPPPSGSKRQEPRESRTISPSTKVQSTANVSGVQTKSRT